MTPPGSSSTRTVRWLGAVVPKRHARRAVTRSLLKRQIYAAAERHRAHLRRGLWIVRLRAPFDRPQFASAASDALAPRCPRRARNAVRGRARAGARHEATGRAAS